MTPTQLHHARIMIECGCTIEDVTVSLRLSIPQAILAVAPSLHANSREQARVRKMLPIGEAGTKNTRIAA